MLCDSPSCHSLRSIAEFEKHQFLDFSGEGDLNRLLYVHCVVTICALVTLSFSPTQPDHSNFVVIIIIILKRNSPGALINTPEVQR